jgi:hypothetical protein
VCIPRERARIGDLAQLRDLPAEPAHNVEHSDIEETDLGYHLNLRAPERIPIELVVLKAEAATTLTAGAGQSSE